MQPELSLFRERVQRQGILRILSPGKSGYFDKGSIL